MSSYNKVLLMGNLTRDIELKHTPSGHAVANIGLATNRRYKSREGDMKEEVTFVDCEAWGRTAEVMTEYLAKGRPVFIEGRLKLDQWQDQDGKNRSKLKVVVDTFQFVDSRGGGGGGPSGGGGGGRSEQSMASAPTGGGGDHAPISEDDIPF
jgi:single-strand DNA-binding protein